MPSKTYINVVIIPARVIFLDVSDALKGGKYTSFFPRMNKSKEQNRNTYLNKEAIVFPSPRHMYLLCPHGALRLTFQ
jgi:hypothetical protein